MQILIDVTVGDREIRVRFSSSVATLQDALAACRRAFPDAQEFVVLRS